MRVLYAEALRRFPMKMSAPKTVNQTSATCTIGKLFTIRNSEVLVVAAGDLKIDG